jgi:hypothetical protein
MTPQYGRYCAQTNSIESSNLSSKAIRPTFQQTQKQQHFPLLRPTHHDQGSPRKRPQRSKCPWCHLHAQSSRIQKPLHQDVWPDTNLCPLWEQRQPGVRLNLWIRCPPTFTASIFALLNLSITSSGESKLFISIAPILSLSLIIFLSLITKYSTHVTP